MSLAGCVHVRSAWLVIRLPPPPTPLHPSTSARQHRLLILMYTNRGPGGLGARCTRTNTQTPLQPTDNLPRHDVSAALSAASPSGECRPAPEDVFFWRHLTTFCFFCFFLSFYFAPFRLLRLPWSGPTWCTPCTTATKHATGAKKKERKTSTASRGWVQKMWPDSRWRRLRWALFTDEVWQGCTVTILAAWALKYIWNIWPNECRNDNFEPLDLKKQTNICFARRPWRSAITMSHVSPRVWQSTT